MRTTGKLLGRATTMWTALVGAALNLAVLLNVVELNVDQVLGINGFALVLIGILANEENPTTAGTFSATTETPAVTIRKTPE